MKILRQMPMMIAALWVFNCQPLRSCRPPPSAKAPSEAPQAVLLFSSGLEGSIAPCGCTSNPLGGLAKIAQAVNQERAHFSNALLVTTGDFLFPTGAISAALSTQEEAKAQLLARVFRDLNVRAQALSHSDYFYTGTQWKLPNNPWLNGAVQTIATKQMPLSDEASGLKIVKSGDFTIALVGLSLNFNAQCNPEDLCKRLILQGVSDKVRSARQQKVDVVIILSPYNWDTSRTILEKLPDADLMIAGGAPTPHAAISIGNKWLIEAENQGQTLGKLSFHVRGEECASCLWRIDDGGSAQKIQINRRITALQQEITELKTSNPLHQGLSIREKQLSDLRTALQQLEKSAFTPQTGRTIHFERIVLDKKQMKDDPQIAQEVARYNNQLCEWSKAATADTPCPSVKPGEASFIGSASCQTCHAITYETWQKSAHAHAEQTLKNVGKFCDLSCIGCHTVGFNQAGGFCSPQKVGNLSNVGCEACHGPASLHIQNGGQIKASGPLFIPRPGENTCRTCHTPEHSDLFNFTTYLPHILGPGHQKK